MTKNTMSIISVVLLALFLASCTQIPQSSAPTSQSAVSRVTSSFASPTISSSQIISVALSPEADILPLSVDNYPLVDGSTAALPLMAQVYSTVCGVPLSEAEKLVEASKTSYAWERLLGSKGGMLLLVYEPPEGFESDRMEGLEIHSIGRDALVFFGNSSNPVRNLTQQQLRDIYTGRITNWASLGGNDEEITAFQRNYGSASQTLFLKLLMGDEDPMVPPIGGAPGDRGSLIDDLAKYDNSRNAIGFSVHYYAREMHSDPALQFFSVDGVTPSNKTIADGSYPLVNEFYLAIRKDEPAGSPARLLFEWMLSEQGTQALLDAGYVPAE